MLRQQVFMETSQTLVAQRQLEQYTDLKENRLRRHRKKNRLTDCPRKVVIGMKSHVRLLGFIFNALQMTYSSN